MTMASSVQNMNVRRPCRPPGPDSPLPAGAALQLGVPCALAGLAPCTLSQPAAVDRPCARAVALQAMSVHSYGKTGFGLGALGLEFVPFIAGNRSRLLGDPATLPFVVTEHSPHTTAAWNTIETTADVYYEASRMGSQILFQALNGFSSCAAPSRPGCAVPCPRACPPQGHRALLSAQ